MTPISQLIESRRLQPFTRRDLVKGTVGLALSIPLASALLVACGDDDEEPPASGSDDDSDVAEDGDDASEDEEPEEEEPDESEEPEDEDEDAEEEPSTEPTSDTDDRPPFRSILLRHALKNASLPVITLSP